MTVRSGGAIPLTVRARVHERDQRTCRMCGRKDRPVSIHHVVFGGDERGMGGPRVHDVEELVSLDDHCHAVAHSDKRLWQDLLLQAIKTPGVTALQLKRWNERLVHEESQT